ncbi:hypothetical protein V1504DRAFT_445950, partial [Lipomyces starkeyi]
MTAMSRSRNTSLSSSELESATVSRHNWRSLRERMEKIRSVGVWKCRKKASRRNMNGFALNARNPGEPLTRLTHSPPFRHAIALFSYLVVVSDPVVSIFRVLRGLYCCFLFPCFFQLIALILHSSRQRWYR